MSAESLPQAMGPEHLTDVLRRSGALGEGRVRGVAVESSRTMVISRITRLRLDYEGEAPGAPGLLFFKTGLPEHAGSGWMSGRQEVAFYKTIAPLMSQRMLPRCFDAHWEPATNEWSLLLEDLKDSHVIATNWPIPPTFEQCQRILRAWAGFHAEWWDDPRLGAGVGSWLDTDTKEREKKGFTELFARFVDRFGDRLPPERRALYERLLGAGRHLWARYDSHRNLTLVHGDAHFWNCFLPKDEGDDVRLFDWDAWRVGLSSDDLAYMMAMHWYPDRRRRFERPLLDHYHAALVEHGVRGYDRSALDDDYRLSVLGLIGRPVWQAMNGLPPVIWWNNLERILTAVDDLRCGELMS